MAARNIEVVIKVRDNASKKLDDLERKVKKTGKGAKKASADFKGFNRTLFATTAFIGTFIKTFSTMAKNLDLGATLDRVDNQFERVLGPSSKMLNNIRNLTDATVDSVEAMRAGIALSNLGITHSSEDTARFIAMSAVAARNAGKDTTEGIKKMTEFVKSGSTASLEFLNLTRTTNPAFTAQIELMKKAGGALGGTLSIQQKYAIGMRLLELKTRDTMKGQRDLSDVLLGVKNNFSMLRMGIGRFLGAALAPAIDKISDLFWRMYTGIETLRQNSKELRFLAKATVITTGAALGLAGALGTLRLASMALGSLGFGFGKLIFLTATLGAGFLGITNKAKSLTDKLKVFGGFIQGIWQLVTGFDEETGISKIDSSLTKLLKENKIFEFAKIISRGAILVKKSVEDLMSLIKDVAFGVDDLFGNAFSNIIKYVSDFNEPWDKALLGAEKKYHRIAGLVTLIGGGFLLKKLMGKALSKLPVIGGFFGSGGKGPKGTATDPIFTASVGAAIDKVSGFFGGKAAKIGGALGKMRSKAMQNIAVLLGNIRTPLSQLPLLLGPMATGLMTLSGVLAAAGIGVLAGKAINKGLDTFTQSENQYGQKYNWAEQGWGKLFSVLPKSMGGISQEDYQDSFDFSKMKQFNKPGERTAVVNVPKPDNTIAYLDSIGAQMSKLDDAESKKLQSATEKALTKTSDGGAMITDEEMNMLTGSFGRALDSSKVMGEIRDNTRTGIANPMNRRP